MPYIEQQFREAALTDPQDSGELNFAITKLLLKYLGEAPRYQDFNDVLGALEGAKHEIYRRRIAPYENGKILSNGDVF